MTMETYLKKLSDDEKNMLNKYASARVLLYIFILMNYFIAITVFSLEPILMKRQRLPLNAWYPFSIDSTAMLTILYVQQIIAMTHSLGSAIFDFIATTLLWSLAARMELLQNDFRQISSKSELKSSVLKHRELIR